MCKELQFANLKYKKWKGQHMRTHVSNIPDQFVRSCAQTRGVRVPILLVKDTINYAQIYVERIYLIHIHSRNVRIYVGNVSEIVMHVQTTLMLIL
jgi:hypothetical protein